jgi:CBS domain-containing protein
VLSPVTVMMAPIPEIERGRLVGIVSIGDMVQSVIGDQKFIIEQLEHYIHGDR